MGFVILGVWSFISGVLTFRGSSHKCPPKYNTGVLKQGNFCGVVERSCIFFVSFVKVTCIL